MSASVNGRSAVYTRKQASGSGIKNKFSTTVVTYTFPKTKAEPPYTFPFTDVPTGAWYYSSVLGAHKMGLINGKTETLYMPENNMTYAEAVKLAACMHQLYNDGEVTLTNGSPYWYSSYFEYCRDNGIIPEKSNAFEPGCDDLLKIADTTITRAGIVNGRDIRGTFIPDSNIQRSEVAAILIRMMDPTARVAAPAELGK